MKSGISAIVTTLVAGLALAAPAYAECVYPKAPESAPNGNTATEAEMVSAMRTYKQYDADVTAYLKCLDDEANARILEAGDNADVVKRIKSVTATKHNAAIDELQSRADDFNTQLKAFKAKQKS